MNPGPPEYEALSANHSTTFCKSRTTIKPSHLQFILIEYAEQVVWNELIKSFEEVLHLVLEVIGKPVLRQCIKILVLGAILDPQLCPSLHQLHNLFLNGTQHSE